MANGKGKGLNYLGVASGYIGIQLESDFVWGHCTQCFHNMHRRVYSDFVLTELTCDVAYFSQF